MLCSRYRQRIGDHMARTLVIATGPAYRGRSQFAGTGSGQMGMGTGADVRSGQMQSTDVGPEAPGGVR